MQSLGRALWRGALQSGKIFRTAEAPSMKGTLNVSIHQRSSDFLSGLHCIPCRHMRIVGWARKMEDPKGVKGEAWRRRPVKKKKRKVYSPYTIRATRFYSRQRCLSFLREESERDAAERARAEEEMKAKQKEKMKKSKVKTPIKKAIYAGGRAAFVSAMVPFTREKNPEIPDYCPPVVKRIDPWRAKWTPPFKKPRQDYQVGRARPLAKAMVKSVMKDKAVSKAIAQRKRFEKRFKRAPMRPKQRMEFT